MPPLEPSHWIILGAVALMLLSIVRRVLNPPKPLQWLEVPAPVRQAVESSLPGFSPLSQQVFEGGRKYKIDGSYRGHTGRVEVEMGAQGEVKEIEYDENPGSKLTTGLEDCELTDFPPVVLDHIQQLMGSESDQYQPYRVRRGKLRGETVFKTKGHTPDWKWEFEVMESGRLAELEKERHR